MRLFTLLFFTLTFLHALELSQLPPQLTIEGEQGGKLDGSAFESSMIKDKLYILFYVDPDEKELNEHVSSALKAQNFDKNLVASIAIINMAATWLPNFAIASSLEEKQKKYPNTLYVKDFKKVLVNQWQLKDDSSNVLLFDNDGSLLFMKQGKLSDEEVQTVIAMIKARI